MLSIFKKKKKRKKTKLRKQKKIYFKLSTTKLYGSSIFYKKKKRIKFRRKLTSFNYKKLNQIFYHTRLFKKKKLRLRKNKTILCPSTLSLNFKKKKIKKINKFTKNNLKTRYLSLSNRSVFDCLDDISMERFIVDSE